MAPRSTKASVVLLDVAEPMHEWLPAATTSISQNMAAKALNSPSDQMSLVLYGATGTKNSVHTEVGDGQQYLRIEEVWPLKCAHKEEFSALENVPRGRGNRPAEVLEALVVAIDLLKNAVGPSKGKQTAEIVLISNFLAETAPTDDGLLDAVVGQLQKVNVLLKVVFLKMQPEWGLPEAITRVVDMYGNQSTVTTVCSRAELLADTFKTKDVTPTTTYRGPLNISSDLGLPVWVYKKTSKVAAPSLRPYSDKVACDDHSATHEVRMDREIKSKSNPEKILAPEELVRGAPYGSQMVPVDDMTEKILKFSAAEKGFKVLRFVPAEDIPREHYMEETSVVMPEPKNESASRAMSAFVRAMGKTGKVAIARAIWRANSARVILGVLTPYMGSASRAEGLLFNELPFAEDYRPFTFPSFDNEKVKPSKEQVRAMKEIIGNMKLDTDQEQLRPEATGSPQIAAFYQAVAASLGHKSAKRQLEVLESRLAKRPCGVADDTCTSKGQVLARYLNGGSEQPGRGDSAGAASSELPAGMDGTEASVSAVGGNALAVAMVGSATPAQDFIEMMKHPAQQSNAMSQLKTKILQLVQESIGDRFYAKALELLTTMRQQCKEADLDHALGFNDFFYSLSSKFRSDPAYGGFWKLVLESGTGAITDSEVPGCATASEDGTHTSPAKLGGKSQTQEEQVPAAAANGPGLDDASDDFDDMD